MEKIVIRGGVPLRGKVEVSGSKNAALPAICASLLSGDEMTFYKIPSLRDIRTTKQLLLQLGVQPRRLHHGHIEDQGQRDCRSHGPLRARENHAGFGYGFGPFDGQGR